MLQKISRLVVLTGIGVCPLNAHPDHGDEYPAAAEVDMATGQEVIGHNGLRYRVNREYNPHHCGCAAKKQIPIS